mgnify:CR=1 FL=1
MLVKEDLGLTILMAGLAIALRGLQERREDRQAVRSGLITREQFRAQRQANRQGFRQDLRELP